MNATVVRAGFLSTVQDLGRLGHRAEGVSLGGALDSHLLRILNLLVGNEEDAAGLEVTLGKVRMRFADDRLVAWGGGTFETKIGDREIPAGHAATINAGEELCMTASDDSGRGWLAFSGGIDVPLVLGSRSTDLRGSFGGFRGRALRDGDELSLGQSSACAGFVLDRMGISTISAPQEWIRPKPIRGFLRVIKGRHWSHFESDILVRETFRISSDADRMGARLEGVELLQNECAELLSEAVMPGTIQVPPNGNPILLLGDCQTIGGYPKIAHVITVDFPAAAQLRSGDAVRFAEVSLEEAQHLLGERERDLARFRVGLRLRR